ncbi:MAG: 2-ketoisovalerate ferredoxin oxidoreductase [Candidatus Aenigmarchaeota archaeon ex4484_14]|nr:MAG: 2-ketoisovalerate ferredoxin oxidoreductase [Candidatus Aenigmarchaeota archaeon ex4484_14]
MMTDLFRKGHNACAGCPAAIAIRNIMQAAGPNTIVSIATSCSEIISTQYPRTAWGVNCVHCAFENAAAVASGIEKAMKVRGQEDINIIAIAGDGGTSDIGLQALSGMLERGHNVLYVCYDNECYANTGIQRSSATPYGAWTTTSPPGRLSIGNETFKKPLAEIAAAHKIPYVATASVAYPDDLQRKVKKALSIRGPKFIHVQAPCPIAWRFDSSMTVSVGRLAVETGMWVLYEIENGILKINQRPTGKKVEEYLKVQGRFKHLKPKDIEKIQKRVDEDWKNYQEWEKAEVKL